MRERLLFGIARFERFNRAAIVSAVALGTLFGLGSSEGASAQEATPPAVAASAPVAPPQDQAVAAPVPAPQAVAAPTSQAVAAPAPQAVAAPAPQSGTAPAAQPQAALPENAGAAAPQTGPRLDGNGVSTPPEASPAPPVPPEIVEVETALPHHDLSPMGMFLAADPVVKSVMLLLAAASVATWTVLLVKVFGLMAAKRRMRKFIGILREANSLSDATAHVRKGAGARLLREAVEEANLSRGLPSEGVKERVHIALSRIEAAMGRRMAIGTGLLATIGSVGPFVGLFGTVWGIMRSFIGIANSNTTNLAVVAPGIAEALLATGIGLVAAIPAVVIYNSMTRSIGGYRAQTGDAVALIMRHLSRDLDRHEFGSSIHHRAHARMAAE